MKNAIIVHGMPDKDEYYAVEFPSASNSHWLPWLQKQLIIHDIKADTPEMPHAYEPEYEVWKQEFERFDVAPETILVGHSCGAGFLVRWLSESPHTKVSKVVLVAPWLNTEKERDITFFDFVLDEALVQRIPITIFESTNDDYYVQQSVAVLRKKLPTATIVTFKDHGHFCKSDLGTDAFPELLLEVLK